MIPWSQEAQVLDSLIVLPQSVLVFASDSVQIEDWELNERGVFIMTSAPEQDSLKIEYRVLPILYTETISLKDTSIIRPVFEYEDPFAYKPSQSDRSALFQLDGFEKSGSISRGIQVGNAQDLSVNSDLNLQLAGKVTDKISLLANISDDNIPIQADGSTQQLQEFDQVYIKLFTDKSSLIAGDYQVASQRGYFSQYLKKARGALFETEQSIGKESQDSLSVLKVRAGAAVSRGKFSRNVIQGVEGNQGPYRLTGAENELFVIILSGTERVYIDGRLMKRGAEYDYTIDYNSSELTFTPSQLITKDRRIVVEFQYAQQSYARSLMQLGLDFKKGEWSSFIDLYSEQDSKNQSLQQDLDADDKLLLSNIGDNINQAFTSNVDSIEFAEDLVLYNLTDSLGYDTVFVYSTNPETARFQLSFTRVDFGSGDYIEEDFTANGRVYKWVAPDTIAGQIVRNGDHVPGLLLVSPKSQQVLSAGVRYGKGVDRWVEFEGALSNFDQNTFSKKDADDDFGHAARLRAAYAIPLNEKSALNIKGLIEETQNEFVYVERYRAVEFERNWNLDVLDLAGDQLQSSLDVEYKKKSNQRLSYSIGSLTSTSDYAGLRHGMEAKWYAGKWKIDGIGSRLSTSGTKTTEFTRHKVDVSRAFGKLRIGFKDEREENKFELLADSLSSVSYRFYQWESYLSSGDSSEWSYRAFYRERSDWRPTASQLLTSAIAHEYGLELANKQSSKHSIKIVSTWRDLKVTREELINSSPEQTFLGRIDYRSTLLNGVMRTSTFYEVGSGLDRRKQFVYIEVPAGQGVYVWVDYNGDEVRNLDEFEIAQFQYEANFIRVFTPTDVFEKTFSNQVAQTLSLEPKKVWRSERGVKGFVGRFSDQASWRADRKTKQEEGLDAYNPFAQNLEDTVLLSLNSSFRNSLFFNRTNPVWSMDYSYTNVKNKQLLTNGFESRGTEENKLNGRYTIERKVTLRLSYAAGRSLRDASYSSVRDYYLRNWSLQPSVEWQPDKTVRITLKSDLGEKQNRGTDSERAEIYKMGLEARLNQIEKGSFNAGFDYVRISYSGLENTSLAFEMLDGLKTGDNFTWNLFMQRSIAKNLELNVTYNGRKSEDNKTIHAGGMQVRAFF